MQEKEKMSGEALLERLRGVRLLSLDVDGVLTDGGLYYTDEGITLRRFNVKDGMGIKLLQRHTDVQVAIVSAGKNDAIAHRGRDLGIEHVRFRVADKLSALTDICAIPIRPFALIGIFSAYCTSRTQGSMNYAR